MHAEFLFLLDAGSIIAGIVFAAIGLLAIFEGIFLFVSKALGWVVTVQGHSIQAQPEGIAMLLRVLAVVIGLAFLGTGIWRIAAGA